MPRIFHEVLVFLLTGWVAMRALAAEIPPPLFKEAGLIELDLIIPPEQMDLLRGQGRARLRNGAQLVKIQVVEGGRCYSNVLVHLKGGGTFRPLDDRPSFTLDFNETDGKQRFHGLTKLSLNNSMQDPTCLNERLGRELFAQAGVPVARADNLFLKMNGKPLGVYVAVEGTGRQFLKKHFKDASGTLYDAGFLLDVHQPLSVSAGPKPADRSKLANLAAATLERDPKKRFELFRELLDLEEFVSFLAMETIVCHWDGYSMNRGNYRLYHDPSRNKFVFMPHGMDRILGNFMPNLDLPVAPPMQGIVARALISTPEGRAMHLKRVAFLSTNLFRPEALKTRVREMDRKISARMEHPELRWPALNLPVVLDRRSASMREKSRLFEVPTIGSHAEDVEDLCGRIDKRAEHLAKQLKEDPALFAAAPPPKFDPNGVAWLAGWQLKTVDESPARLRQRSDVRESLTGTPSLTVTNRVGRKILLLNLPPGCKRASIRKRVSLSAGNYSLKGNVQAAGTGGLIPAVMLHHSGNRFGNEMRPASWTQMAFDFQVLPGGADAEVELIWDVRDGPGQVEFEAESLELIHPR